MCCACTLEWLICRQLQWPNMPNASAELSVWCTKLACCLQDDAADAQWFPVGQLPPLAFDHKEVVRTVFEKLAQRQEASTEGSHNCVTRQLDFRSMFQMHLVQMRHGGRA